MKSEPAASHNMSIPFCSVIMATFHHHRYLFAEVGQGLERAEFRVEAGGRR